VPLSRVALLGSGRVNRLIDMESIDL